MNTKSGLPVNWHFNRTELAQSYLDFFEQSGGAPITIFSGRRKGKTTLLRQDLEPLAVESGYFPVYVDFWEMKGDAFGVLLDSLDQARQSLLVPSKRVRQILNVPVKSLSIAGVGIDFGDTPERERPERGPMQIRWLLEEIGRLSKKPVLLMLDEFQQIAIDPKGEEFAGSLRASMIQLKGHVLPIFSGSSETKLSALFHRSRAPLYNFSSHKPLPDMDKEFIHHLCRCYRLTTGGAELNGPALWYAFREMQFQPGGLIDVVMDLINRGSNDVPSAIKSYLADRRRQDDLDFCEAVKGLSDLDRLILQKIAKKEPVRGPEARARHAKDLEVFEIKESAVKDSIAVLASRELVSTDVDGNYRIAGDSIWRRLAGKLAPANIWGGGESQTEAAGLTTTN